MNLAAIILQLVSFCSIRLDQSKCQDYMIQCATKHYNTQQVEQTSDYCLKKFLNR